MYKLTIVLLTATSVYGVNGTLEPKDYQKVADRATWTWSDEKASLAYCVKTFKAKQNGDTVRIREYQFAAEPAAVFTVEGGRLFAVFSPEQCECRATAVDLKTGKKIWAVKVTDTGPVVRRVNIETDGTTVTVWVNESAGRHVEILDAKTGKTVGHKVFKGD
jgi:hypothetical protein